jgi:hypothetical protein
MVSFNMGSTKQEKEFIKLVKQEIKECCIGLLNGYVLLNKYKTPLFCTPSQLNKTYQFDLQRGDIKPYLLTKEEYLFLYNIEKEIKTLINKKNDYMLKLIKEKEKTNENTKQH